MDSGRAVSDSNLKLGSSVEKATSGGDFLISLIGALPFVLALYFIGLLVWQYQRYPSRHSAHSPTKRKLKKPDKQCRKEPVASKPPNARTDSDAPVTNDLPAPAAARAAPLRSSSSSSLCKRCEVVPAKTGCRYSFCRPCCVAQPMSVCAPHNTGARVASMLLDEAILYPPSILDFSYQHLRWCSPRLGKIGESLTSLNLSNNRLTQIPEEISNLVNIEELFLQYNLLERLPESISSLTELAEFDIKNNLLKELPDSIGNLDQLIILNVTNNSLRTLPDSISNLSQLEELCLHANTITHLPEGFCLLTNLLSLYVGNNRLSSLPEEFGNLSHLNELDLSNNELTGLPESFVKCAALERLWLSKNRLKYLPSRIGWLSRLSELHVQDNELRYLPLSVQRLRLYTLTSNGNPFLSFWSKAAIRKMEYKVYESFPSLQELAARAIMKLPILPQKGVLPNSFLDMIRQVQWCTNCGGPYFTFAHRRIVFCTVAIYYRLPLLEEHCSPNACHVCKPFISPD